MNKMKSAKSLAKPPPLMANKQTAMTDNFEIELYWCVQQLGIALHSGKLSKKLADDTAANIRVLKSATAPIIKKRQVMKLALGDYRTRMKEEEKKMALAPKQIKFTPPAADLNKKCNFVKKCAILNSNKDFRFNFNPPTEDAQQECPPASTTTTTNEINLKWNTGSEFKFNFSIDGVSDDLNFNGLAISTVK